MSAFNIFAVMNISVCVFHYYYEGSLSIGGVKLKMVRALALQSSIQLDYHLKSFHCYCFFLNVNVVR